MKAAAACCADTDKTHTTGSDVLPIYRTTPTYFELLQLAIEKTDGWKC